MTKVNTDYQTTNWNNVKPVYVKAREHSEFIAPLWVLVISVAINTVFNIITTLSHYMVTLNKF